MQPDIPLRIRLQYGSLAYTATLADDDARYERALAFVRAQPEVRERGQLDEDKARAWALALMEMQGHPHKNPGGKRVPKSMQKRTRAQVPSRDAVMSWANFVLYAVVGRMREADSILYERRALVLEMAAWMRSERPVKVGDVYRGVLVEPAAIQGGKLMADPRLQFLSWTEDLQVACWFANPDSIISEVVRERMPNVRGYIATGKPTAASILWHHDWVDIPVPGGDTMSLAIFAGMHPHIDEGQFLWNVESQSEVMTLPPADASTMSVVAVSDFDCEEIDELDTRLTYPIFLAQRFSIR